MYITLIYRKEYINTDTNLINNNDIDNFSLNYSPLPQSNQALVGNNQAFNSSRRMQSNCSYDLTLIDEPPKWKSEFKFKKNYNKIFNHK